MGDYASTRLGKGEGDERLERGTKLKGLSPREYKPKQTTYSIHT
jgi:hypothetical protein